MELCEKSIAERDATIARLTNALEEIAQAQSENDVMTWRNLVALMGGIARAALEKEGS